MDRTWRAALIAMFVPAVGLTLLLVYLGLDLGPSLTASATIGLAMGGLLLAASRRADTFHTDDEVDRG